MIQALLRHGVTTDGFAAVRSRLCPPQPSVVALFVTYEFTSQCRSRFPLRWTGPDGFIADFAARLPRPQDGSSCLHDLFHSVSVGYGIGALPAVVSTLQGAGVTIYGIENALSSAGRRADGVTPLHLICGSTSPGAHHMWTDIVRSGMIAARHWRWALTHTKDAARLLGPAHSPALSSADRSSCPANVPA